MINDADPGSPTSRGAAIPPWDIELAAREGPGTLVHVAREGRLFRKGRRVFLTWVDEAALALVEAAMERRKDLNLVYPAPAGEVGILLAAQILIHKLASGETSRAVGLVTADTTQAAKTWSELELRHGTVRVGLEEVFPVWRAGPDGESPFNGRGFYGVLIGRRCRSWASDVVVFDHLAGPVTGKTESPNLRVYADPLDPQLQAGVGEAELVRKSCRRGYPALPDIAPMAALGSGGSAPRRVDGVDFSKTMFTRSP